MNPHNLPEDVVVWQECFGGVVCGGGQRQFVYKHKFAEWLLFLISQGTNIDELGKYALFVTTSTDNTTERFYLHATYVTMAKALGVKDAPTPKWINSGLSVFFDVKPFIKLRLKMKAVAKARLTELIKEKVKNYANCNPTHHS